MLSFATEFPVKNTDLRAFIEAVRAWLLGSPHTKFTKDQLAGIELDGRWTASADSEYLESLIAPNPHGGTAAFRYRTSDENIEWITTVVYSGTEDDCWVGIRIARESKHAKATLPPAKKPFLVRNILQFLSGGLDGEIYVSDTPLELKETDIGMATRLLNSDAETYLPIIYISRDFSENIAINCRALARQVAGMAHVVIEPSRNFSRLIQPQVSSRNAYGGTVGVYWPNGEYFKYYLSEDVPNEHSLRALIVDRIRSALCNRRPLPRCTWSRAEAEVAHSVFTDLLKSGSEDVSEYVKVFDSEIKAKNEQLDAAEEEISSLKNKLVQLSSQINSPNSQIQPNNEQEFFAGEFDEILREALVRSLSFESEDSRRYHVLSSFVSSLNATSILSERQEIIKGALRGYKSVDRNLERAFSSLGFKLTSGKTHYKAVYMDDGRYTFSVATTPSDNRAGLNLASDICKKVF